MGQKLSSEEVNDSLQVFYQGIYFYLLFLLFLLIFLNIYAVNPILNNEVNEAFVKSDKDKTGLVRYNELERVTPEILFKIDKEACYFHKENNVMDHNAVAKEIRYHQVDTGTLLSLDDFRVIIMCWIYKLNELRIEINKTNTKEHIQANTWIRAEEAQYVGSQLYIFMFIFIYIFV
eukprot:GHVR01020031.1.p1 GENE.GHVR01020031.1~~GHVR01020031.1.p1  ORF type:complete len:176 (+),score=21.46 GHVR01020031.1:212-739(+)